MHVALSGNLAQCDARLKTQTHGRRSAHRCRTGQQTLSVLSPRSPHKPLKRDQFVQLYGTAALCCLTAGDSGAAFASDAIAASQSYVPGPVNIGWEVWVGAIAGVIPFAIGSYQFVARILMQRRCPRCSGSGLIERGPFLRKCPECGGFFPWQGWKQFLTSTATPGNGGVLRQPQNQEGVIYKIPPKAKSEAQNKP